MNKAQVRVMSDTQCYVAKRGRPVSRTTALSALRRAFPAVPAAEWCLLGRSDHSTVALREAGGLLALGGPTAGQAGKLRRVVGEGGEARWQAVPTIPRQP